FSKNSEIDLYGAGWTKPVKYTGGHFSASIQKSYRGYVRDKLATLRNYKFCLCFENVVFGGLVSEKIIDCLFAGCLPIYFGAPDITDYIPSNVFIDLRNFKDYQELNIYLKNMNEKTYGQYLENINRFTRSKEGYNFTQEKFARDLIKTFKSYFQFS
ncbi:MAG: glycosyltransferase family 10, partial [Patescibacteria group bacterium]